MPELQIAPEEKPKRQRAAKKTPRFQLGQKIEFRSTVEKKRAGYDVTWEKKPLPFRNSYYLEDTKWAERRKVYSTGIVLGLRTLTDYVVETDYDDYAGFGSKTFVVGATPVSGTQRRAWLVAFDMQRKPALVLDEDAFAVCPVCEMTDNHYGLEPEKLRGWREHHDDLCDGRWWPQE